MISVIFLYSNDKQKLFENTIKCLEMVQGYKECEKIVCSDGKSEFKYKDYKVIPVIRKGKNYNWSLVFREGVSAASYEVLWYLDCDRIVPENYLNEAVKLLKPKTWVYPGKTWHVSRNINFLELKKIQNGTSEEMLELEKRVSNPPNLITLESGKNPFSGNALFTKNSFLESGGLDCNFDGYGYADLDYYMKMYHLGCEFSPVSQEWHQWHPHAVQTLEDFKLMVYNGLIYCEKWHLKPHEMLLNNCIKAKIKTKYVKYGRSFEKYLALEKVKI